MQGMRMQGVCTQGMHAQGVCVQGGGDTQPIRLQVGTLSQTDYTRVVCKDACARVACAGGARRGGRDTQPIRTGGARRVVRRCAEVREGVTIGCP